MINRNYFKGKRVALIGLGPHGEMMEDAKFLIKSGALLSVYDLRSEARLKNDLIFLRSIGLANYVCSSIPHEDLLDNELVILSHDYPRESSFLEKVKEKGIPIEYPETLFFKMAPPLTIVGIIGAVGKSSVMSMLAPMLELACNKEEVASGQNLFAADVENGDGILSHLKKAKNGDILLLKITPKLMTEMHTLRISPHVAVFTSLPHPSTYSKSPFEILEFQTYNNFLIASDEIIDMTREYDFKPRAKMLRTKPNIIPPIWELNLHSFDKNNLALALQAAFLFRVSDEEVKHLIEKWLPLKGRLEMIKKIKGIEFYNDTASSLPHSTIVALSALSKKKNVVLIVGGSDTGVEYGELVKAIPQHVHTLILIPGSGTMKNRHFFQSIEGVKVLSAPGIDEAVRLARENASAGDLVLFSPAFAAGGVFSSRKERGEKFMRAVRML